MPANDPAIDESREETVENEKIPNTHPWRRYFARTAIDILILGIFPGVVTYMALLAAIPRLFVWGAFVIMVFIFFSWFFIESFLLHFVSTTPGKWLFGIYVRDSKGGGLSPGQALSRTGHVMWAGLGMGIPIVSLFTCYFGYKRLTKTGTTLWDEGSGSTVVHKPISLLRRATAGIIVVLIYLLLFLAQLLPD